MKSPAKQGFFLEWLIEIRLSEDLSVNKYFYIKMFTIRGRACRSEFWWYALFMFFLVMPLIAGCVPDDVMIGSALELLAKISLAAVTIRRLHDKNRNGLWIVPVFLPWIGSVYLFMLLVCFCFKGTPEENRYGVDPLG